MKSRIAKRSVLIAGHKTSVSLEDAFWKALHEIAADRDTSLTDLLASIDGQREHDNMSSAIRLFILDHYRKRLAEEITARGPSRQATNETRQAARPLRRRKGPADPGEKA
jgi:predicted DNA-binding ribbon-helix-helix protein